MTITFENNNDVIVYALEKVISYARRTQQIFVAQCVWWLASIIGLEQGLVNYIDNIQTRQKVNVLLGKALDNKKTMSPVPRDIQEDKRQNQVLKECEEYLQESRRLRSVATREVDETVRTGQVESTRVSNKFLKKVDRKGRRNPKPDISQPQRVEKKRKAKVFHQTEGIDEAEIQKRKSEGEFLRCAWPADRKGTHKVKDCIRSIKLKRGTASYPKAKEYQKIKQARIQPSIEEDSSGIWSSEESSDDSL